MKNAFDIYSSEELGKHLVAFQVGLDSCKSGSSAHAFYRGMISGIARELLNRYRQETELLNRRAGVQ
jgi:hypothetical protein